MKVQRLVSEYYIYNNLATNALQYYKIILMTQSELNRKIKKVRIKSLSDNTFVHVIIGTIFIAVSLMRIINYQLTTKHHNGFESSILYWHFVDVVWLFLFVAVYFWGNN